MRSRKSHQSRSRIEAAAQRPDRKFELRSMKGGISNVPGNNDGSVFCVKFRGLLGINAFDSVIFESRQGALLH